MKLVLPANIAGQAAGEVACRGQVVRIASTEAFSSRSMVAATIGSFKLVPQPEPAQGQDSQA